MPFQWEQRKDRYTHQTKRIKKLCNQLENTPKTRASRPAHPPGRRAFSWTVVVFFCLSSLSLVSLQADNKADTRMVDPMRTAIFADANIEVHRDAFNRGELFRLTKKPPQQAAFLRETLLAIPMCEDVNDQQLERLVGAMELVRLQPREVCVRAGTPNPFMYVVAAGRVSLTRPKPGPEEHIGPGAIFGQEALARSAPADFTAVAGGGCAVFRLHRAAFKLLQVDYGMRLRAAIGSVMGQRRQEQQAGMSAMQLIVMQAQQKRMEQKRLAEAHPEFADVPAALGSCQDVATLGKGNFGPRVTRLRSWLANPSARLTSASARAFSASARAFSARHLACQSASSICDYRMTRDNQRDPALDRPTGKCRRKVT